MERSAETSSPSPLLVGILLALIVLLALALRLLAIDHGLPEVVGPDEGFEIHRALRLGLGEFDLERIAKGGFFYLLFVEYGFYFVFLRLTGAVSEASQFAERFATDLTPFWLIARVTHAVVGALTVVVTFLLGRACYHPVVGLLAAAAVAVSSLHVSRSMYVGVDVPMAFLVVVVLFLAHRWKESETLSFAVLLGASLGLAAMTKLTAVVLVFPLAVAATTLGSRWNWRALYSKPVACMFLTAAVVFVAGNPGFVLRFRTLAVALVGNTLLGVEAAHPSELFAEGGTGENLWLFYWRALASGMGLAWLLLSLAGLLMALVRRRREDLLLASFALPFFLLVAGSQSKHFYYSRYVMPLIPLLSVLAALALWTAVSRVPLRAGARLAIAGGFAAFVLAPNLATSASVVGDLRRGDTRIEARRWIESNIPPGSALFLVGNPLVDTAPNLSLPLRDSDANMLALAEAIRAGEPTKAAFLDTRREAGRGVPYDLHTVQHFEPVPTLSEAMEQGVRYFALVGDLFDPALLAGDTKHSSRVLESRRRLVDDLSAAELIFRIDAEEAKLAGPWVEIYRVDDPLGS